MAICLNKAVAHFKAVELTCIDGAIKLFYTLNTTAAPYMAIIISCPTTALLETPTVFASVLGVLISSLPPPGSSLSPSPPNVPLCRAVLLRCRAHVQVLEGVLRGDGPITVSPGALRPHSRSQPQPPSPEDPQVSYSCSCTFLYLFLSQAMRVCLL